MTAAAAAAAAAAVCLTAWLAGQSGGTIGPRAAP